MRGDGLVDVVGGGADACAESVVEAGGGWCGGGFGGDVAEGGGVGVFGDDAEGLGGRLEVGVDGWWMGDGRAYHFGGVCGVCLVESSVWECILLWLWLWP